MSVMTSGSETDTDLEDDEVTMVVSSESMDDETLRLHLNARHLPISGVPSLPAQWSRHAEPFSMWREYHDAVHRIALNNEVKGHIHQQKER